MEALLDAEVAAARPRLTGVEAIALAPARVDRRAGDLELLRPRMFLFAAPRQG